EAVARIAAQEFAEGLFGERVILALDVTRAEIVLIARRVARRSDGRDRVRVGTSATHIVQVERLAGIAAAACADRTLWRGRLTRGQRAERARRAGRIRIGVRIESITAGST